MDVYYNYEEIINKDILIAIKTLGTYSDNLINLI